MAVSFSIRYPFVTFCAREKTFVLMYGFASHCSVSAFLVSTCGILNFEVWVILGVFGSFYVLCIQPASHPAIRPASHASHPPSQPCTQPASTQAAMGPDTPPQKYHQKRQPNIHQNINSQIGPKVILNSYTNVVKLV